MSREVVWTKAVVDAFVDEACLSEEEELIIRSRAKGWTRTKQSIQYNMSIRKIDYIIHTLKTKYDEAQKYSEILPKRNIKKAGTECPGFLLYTILAPDACTQLQALDTPLRFSQGFRFLGDGTALPCRQARKGQSICRHIHRDYGGQN